MLAGREAERAAIAALLDAAGSARGGALVVRGVAGSGKSTLLADAVGSAAGMTVVRTQGVESESPLAFAALQRLLRPLRARLPALPAPQRTALRAALGEAAGDGDRFLAFLGVLSLLADAAEESPVLVVVDDAHWLDDASAAALLFAARRLQAERVALLFAARDGDVHDLDAGDLPTVVLGGVGGEDADTLLGAREIDPAVRDHLVTATGGNPLALVELAGVLTGDQLAGRAPLPAPLPLTGGVERGFLDRCRRLTAAAQRFLLVAAADDTSRLPVVVDAARHLDAGDALDEVERAGLVRVEGTGLSLHHPLVRSAVYRAATSAQRRAVHRALADVLAADLDRRAWHLAAAADRPDEAVVAALDAVAERAAARGGHEAAAAAWARAAELTSGSEARGRRLYLAASAAWSGAHPWRAAALATAAGAGVTDPPLRAQLLALQGQIEWTTGSLDDGYDLVLQAAQAASGVDPALARQLAVVASTLAVFGARSPRAVDPGALMPVPAPDAPARVRAAAALLRGFLAAARRDWTAAAGSFREAFALTGTEFVPDHVQRNLGIAALVIGDDERGLRLHERLLTAARRAGALDLVEYALTRGAQFQIAVGAWAEATSAATEALRLAAGTGRAGMTALPTAQLALLSARRGDDAAERQVAEAAAIRQAHQGGVTDTVVVDLLHWARGVRAGRQSATALHHLVQITEPTIRRLAAIDCLEVAVQAGRDDVARAWVEELAAFAAGTGAPAAVAVAEHGRALLAEGPAAEEHLRRALTAHAGSLRLPDRARTELALGEFLRRARRRVDAREHLRAALGLFDDLGAVSYAARAAAELRASGETARRRDVSTATDLSPQERQVTVLVRQGLPTRDVAAQLFLSPRTVEFHLRNVFAKLGVSSRAELAALPLDALPLDALPLDA
ncbi:regulatory LuxR family protein [Geodermatophilus normandii]|uniref:Regulatory LuxR family protein n=1 Tax=Geodermatophilus normandii TaxID=1137989 RepID=A0A317QQ31_9ACTN|nr:LuxR family transcriptional regulator [Geodermatophilus normandii]PWW24265.1 regulatory LuxR family protein [Geodermatophilus normandii]